MTLPAWLGAGPPGPDAPRPSGVRLRPTFAERTLVGLSEFTRDALHADRCALRPGLLQGLDPRTKVVAAFALLIGVGVSRSLALLAIPSLLALALAAASQVEVGRFARRVWLVVLVFGGVAALPALLNVVTPGEPVLPLCRTPEALLRLGWPEALSVTSSGLVVAARLVLRVGASLSVVLLVAHTTPAGEVLKALRALGVPRAFVLVAAMTHRYLGALVATVDELHQGLVSRRLWPVGGAAGRAFVASRVAVVLTRTRRTAEDVHQAMVSRGFRGEVRTLTEPRLRWHDLLAVLLALVLALAVGLGHRAGAP